MGYKGQHGEYKHVPELSLQLNQDAVPEIPSQTHQDSVLSQMLFPVHRFAIERN